MDFGNQESKPKGAKTSLEPGSGFQRRQQKIITLRAGKRNEMVESKRRGDGDDGALAAQAAAAAAGGMSMDPMSFTQKSNPASVPLALLPTFMEMLTSTDDRYVFHGTLMIRKLLSVESNPPIDAVIAAGAVPYFVRFMERADFLELQFEAAWALTNIASGTREHTHLVIQSNAVPLFIQLLSSPSDDCREQATWAIGNLAGEGDKCRDYVLDLGVMPPLLQLITTPCDKITLTRNAVWALANLCRGKPQPKLEQVAVALPVIASLLNHHDDEIVVDATWAISYISDGPTDRVQAVLEAGVVARIVQLLSAPTTAMQTPAIRTIGNIATGSDRQTQVIITSGALPAMHFLLEHPKRAIRKEVCWTLSNITAGHRDQIQAIVNANLFPPILQCTAAMELEVKKEAVWAIANATSGGAPEQIRYLLEINVLQPLCELLTVYDPKVVSVALEALQNLLQVGADDMVAGNHPRNLVAARITELGGLDHIERLQSHSNVDVYQRAFNLLESFFDLEDPAAADPLAVAAGAAAQTGFSFPQDQQQAGGFKF